MKKQNRIGVLWILPSLFGILLFFVLPFFQSVRLTLTQGVFQPRFVGLENFRELLGNPVFLQGVINTGVFLVFGVALALLLSLMVSVVLAKRPFRWQRWVLLLPLVIPAASLSLGWQSLWGADGLLCRALEAMGLPAVDFLHGQAAFPMALGLYLLKNVGYLSVILTSSISTLPAEYRESYRLESDSEAGYLRYILLPLISPSLLFAALVAVMNYFHLFRDIYMLYGDNPPESLYMLQHFMNNNFYKLNYQRLSAAAFLTILCLSALVAAVLLLQRGVRRRVG